MDADALTTVTTVLLAARPSYREHVTVRSKPMSDSAAHMSGPFKRHVVTGALVGAIVGLVLAAGLSWYFAREVASGNTDAGMAYSLWMALLGLPFSLVLPEVMGESGWPISVAALFGCLGIIGGLVVLALRPTRDL
jgi:FtsH-binding integral membrane protein